METKSWNPILNSSPGAHVLQTTQWAEVKTRYGWKPYYLIWSIIDDRLELGYLAKWSSEIFSVRAAALVLERKVAPGLSVMYLPKGPHLVDWEDTQLAERVLTDLEDLARKSGVIQLKIAAELNLPAIVHSREAFDDTVDILDRYGCDVKKIVFHCFSGSADQAKILLAKGFYLSFTGVVTFKNAHTVSQAAKIVPLDRLMIETDCPYISPVPVRNKRPCEPAMLIHTARKLAEIHDITLETFAKAVTQTSEKFFNLLK